MALSTTEFTEVVKVFVQYLTMYLEILTPK